MLTVLFGNKQDYSLLYDFAQRYYDATHPAELAEMAASAVADIVVTAILAIVTAGVGAAANAAAKSGRLTKVAKLHEEIAAILRRSGPEVKFLDKEHETIEAVATVEKQASIAARKHGIPEIKIPYAAKKIEINSLEEYGAVQKSPGPKKTTAGLTNQKWD